METFKLLVSQQNKLAQEIVSIFTNSKKDSSSRKTEEYIQAKKLRLQQLWTEVQSNHEAIIQSTNGQDLESHEYFEKAFFDQIKRKYDETVTYLRDCPKAFSTSTPTNDGEQTKKIKKQEYRIQQLTNYLQHTLAECSDEKSKTWCQFRIKSIQTEWEAIRELHEEVMMNEEQFQASYFHNDGYNQVKQLYEEVVIQLEEKGNDLQNTNITKPNLKLPRIVIPVFNGEYENWASFYDMFSKLIHLNTSLSKIEKMQYLKTHLRGEPTRIIQHLQMTEANYEDAWDLLKRRYHNNRLIFSKLVDKILDLPNIYQESSEKIRLLYDTTSECLKAINNLGIETLQWGPLIGRIISRKWDAQTNRLFEQGLKNPHEVQDYSTIMDFLERRFKSLEAINTTIKKPMFSPKQEVNNPRKMADLCAFCKRDHSIFHCPKFKEMPIQKRVQAIKEKKICGNCLSHSTSEPCKSVQRCHICSRQHHTFLHIQSTKNQPKPTNMSTTRTSSHVATSQANMEVSSQLMSPGQTVLLATAVIKTISNSGEEQLLRVLIDSGSQASFITEKAAQLIGRPRTKIRAEVSGLGNNEPRIATSKINLEVFPRFPSNQSHQVEFLVLSKITSTLPSNQIKISTEDWKTLWLADPTFNVPGPIDAILGAEEYGKILLGDIQRNDSGLLAQNTTLGWILSGNVHNAPQNKINVHSMIIRKEEDAQLTKFWEIEEVSEKKVLSPEDKKCEEYYSSTVQRNPDGRYVVSIPFKTSPQALGESKRKAMARLFQLERSLSRNHNLDVQYNAFLEEYLSLGHMRQINTREEDTGAYYIPHQPVIKEESLTTKLRVVFDASAKTTTNFSLNDTMHAGPRLQDDLSDILLRWRKHRVVFSADIEKMYRQILLTEEDQKYHRILWRFNRSEPIQEFALTTVTYGTTSAPYLAVKTLQQLAKDEETKYPVAARTIKKDVYIDDILSGEDSIERAIQLQNNIIQLLELGKFTLRKWSSNKIELLHNLPEKLKDQTTYEFTTETTRKLLGIHWTPCDDMFYFKVETTQHKHMTKRVILSEIAKIFDPLGWLSPVIISIKLMIQDLWLQNLDWDQRVPKRIEEQWLQFIAQLSTIKSIRIPRWISFTRKMSNHLELYGFCDASEKAYGAVVYAKTIADDQQTVITLLTSKSKVAPARTRTTLPRLELCAAVLLAKLINRIKYSLEISGDVRTTLWTDSMIVLGWIHGDQNRWKTFVANRVSEINSLISPQSWNHVNSTDNPADIISRGVEPSKIVNHSMWWTGPIWLSSKDLWPKQPNIPTTTDEIRICATATVIHQNDILHSFSSLTKLIRVMSYVRRFVNALRKHKPSTNYLSVTELEDTLIQLVKIVQQEEMRADIQALRAGKLNKSSKIFNLNPFIDEQGVMRVGGRLQNSELPYNQKHPIILPYGSHMSNIIIQSAHKQCLHGGNQLTLSQVRTKFWIINGKRAVRNIINKCVPCIRHNANTNHPLMGNLPRRRVVPAIPFEQSAVDYAGPIQMRTTKGRGHKSYKGYIAVFVCMTTKAIHLEAVTDMTTDAFMAAFRRFISRRGQCAHMYSDNGTNFVGASKRLEREITNLSRCSSVQNDIANIGTQWHFIPPAAPHFGGLWEAGVKSMKHHLKRIIGNTTLTYEEMSTLLCQIEACLNSRPLVALSNDIDDLSALTPGHFLIGRKIISQPTSNDCQVEASLSSRWRLIQKMKKDMWKSWSSEYLHSMQQRYKWQSNQENLQVGTLVIVKEDNFGPSTWPLARIVEIHPGNDDVVRVVSIKLANKRIAKKSVHQLIPLPRDQSDNTETTAVSANLAVWSTVSTRKVPSYIHRIKHPDNRAGLKNMISPKVTSQPAYISILLLILLGCCYLVNSSMIPDKYQVRYPQPGLYVEHFGTTQIERGVFRIQLNYNLTKLQEDTHSVEQVVTQYKEMCHQAYNLSKEINCSPLLQHLQEQESEMKWIQEGINGYNVRSKRGLFGKVLTSVFGVNDDVYRELDDLQLNQKELIQASNHQAKFMISALSTFNDTEIRINNQLERFRVKLNRGMAIINEMEKWYKAIDTNQMYIHLLSSYQMASNYIAEQCSHYNKILNVNLNRGRLYDLITLAHLHKAIQAGKAKIPTSLDILDYPIIKMEVKRSAKSITIFSYLLIIDRTEFDTMKVTPTPLKVENGSYWIFNTPNKVLCVDYNNQHYFELDDAEFKMCVNLNNHKYVCSPSSVRNIETNSNCVIQELYQHNNKSSCDIEEHGIQSIVWKQLQMPNTWMFIANKPAKIAITCNGIRDDVLINSSGIIQLSQACNIKTKYNMLTPQRVDTIPVIGSYEKPTLVTINSTFSHQIYKKIRPEPVLRNSDRLGELVADQLHIQDELQGNMWKFIRLHSVATSMSTTIGLGALIAIVWSGYWFIKRFRKRQLDTTRDAVQNPDIEMVELQQLYPNES